MHGRNLKLHVNGNSFGVNHSYKMAHVNGNSYHLKIVTFRTGPAICHNVLKHLCCGII